MSKLRKEIKYNSLRDIIRNRCNAMNMTVRYDNSTCTNCIYTCGEYCTIIGLRNSRMNLESVVE